MSEPGGRGGSGRRRTGDARRRRHPRRSRAPGRTAAYPRLSPAEVLRAIVAFSREITAETSARDLFAVFHRTLQELLPNRSVAVRLVDPKSRRVLAALSEGKIAPDFESRPAMAVDEEPPLPFVRAVAGFSVPLVAAEVMVGEVHVGYRPWPDDTGVGPFPIRADKLLVAPLANHVAVVTHTRHLIGETVYLQGYLEQLIDQANALIVATDASGRVTIWNRAIARLTGEARGDVLGRTLEPWLLQRGAPDLGRLMRQALTTTGEVTGREVLLPSPDTAPRRALFDVVTVRASDGGGGAAALAVGQDVTVLRDLQSQVIHAEKLATVGQIAAGVAHEINNPLTSIQVCAETLLRKVRATRGQADALFDPADEERLRKITEGAERIRRFARDLVSYARPSGNTSEPIALNDLLEQAISFCEHVIEDVGARVEWDLAEALPRLRGVRDQLLQVIINLVTNAAQAVLGRRGRLRVRSWGSAETGVGFAVADNGVGIKEEDRVRIFEPFFTTKPPGEGTGLGLSVVKNIVYSHGGQITCQSAPGAGSTFVVTFPASRLASASKGDRTDE